MMGALRWLLVLFTGIPDPVAPDRQPSRIWIIGGAGHHHHLRSDLLHRHRRSGRTATSSPRHILRSYLRDPVACRRRPHHLQIHAVRSPAPPPDHGRRPGGRAPVRRLHAARPAIRQGAGLAASTSLLEPVVWTQVDGRPVEDAEASAIGGQEPRPPPRPPGCTGPVSYGPSSPALSTTSTSSRSTCRTGLRRPPSRRYPRVFDIGIDSASTSSFRLGHLRLDHSFKRPATTTSVTDRH
ncbi:hypothetical protein OsJ_20968 [Oryza sativa Japonica Group]|uniref:Uncharacterized protein n=1 Tax=Oryza sativa subsp. japonica TaxID=39947 RepID=B9FSR1_ORYSJ|nr:hypothetical protein OsJ_20968 [Oryza sativa Japonica Group]